MLSNISELGCSRFEQTVIRAVYDLRRDSGIDIHQTPEPLYRRCLEGNYDSTVLLNVPQRRQRLENAVLVNGFDSGAHRLFLLRDSSTNAAGAVQFRTKDI